MLVLKVAREATLKYPQTTSATNNMDMRLVQKHISTDNVSYFKALPDAKTVINSHHAKSGDTVLHLACRSGSVKVLEYLINDLKAAVETNKCDGKRPLHDAAQFSQEACVRMLLEHGAEIDPLKRADWTPLMLACTRQSETIIQMLLAAGANPQLRNKDGWNAFHIACREGHLSVIQALVDHYPEVWRTKSNNLRSPLHTAALHGHKNTVLWMMDACQYQPDERDSCGTTPLMDALRAGHIEIGQILMQQHQANVRLEDKTGRQAIHHVTQAGQVAVLTFLVRECGVCVNAKSSTSWETPLHVASKKYLSWDELYLTLNESSVKNTFYACSLLLRKSQEGQTESVAALLKLGCEIDALDSRGRTALHLASAGQHQDIVQLLLRHDAKLVADEVNRLPQDYALKKDVLDAFTAVT